MNLFTKGQRVRYVGRHPNFSEPRHIGETGTVMSDFPALSRAGACVNVEWDRGVNNGNPFPANIELVIPAPAPRSKSWIVCRLDGDKPFPSANPRVMVSEKQAVKVSRELARANPGIEFAVFALHSVSSIPAKPEVSTVEFA